MTSRAKTPTTAVVAERSLKTGTVATAAATGSAATRSNRSDVKRFKQLHGRPSSLFRPSAAVDNESGACGPGIHRLEQS